MHSGLVGAFFILYGGAIDFPITIDECLRAAHGITGALSAKSRQLRKNGLTA